MDAGEARVILPSGTNENDLGLIEHDSVITLTTPSNPPGVIRRTPQHAPALAGVPPEAHQARTQPSTGSEEQVADGLDDVCIFLKMQDHLTGRRGDRHQHPLLLHVPGQHSLRSISCCLL